MQDLLGVPPLLLGYKGVNGDKPYVHIVIAKYFAAPALEFSMMLQVRESETTRPCELYITYWG